MIDEGLFISCEHVFKDFLILNKTLYVSMVECTLRFLQFRKSKKAPALNRRPATFQRAPYIALKMPLSR